MSKATAEARCAEQNNVLCSRYYQHHGVTGSRRESFVWLNQPCAPQVQIHPRTGWINLVETPPDAEMGRETQVHPSFTLNSPEYFRVRWEGGTFPEHSTGCGAGCTSAAKETCVCDVDVTIIPAFTDPTRVPTVDELEKALSLQPD